MGHTPVTTEKGILETCVRLSGPGRGLVPLAPLLGCVAHGNYHSGHAEEDRAILDHLRGPCHVFVTSPTVFVTSRIFYCNLISPSLKFSSSFSISVFYTLKSSASPHIPLKHVILQVYRRMPFDLFQYTNTAWKQGFCR